MMGIALAGGVPPKVAAWAMDRIFLYITADAYEYSIWRTEVVDAGGNKETYIAQLGEDLISYFAQLPPEKYPFIQKHAEAMVGGGIEARFEFGLELLVDGLDKYSPLPDAHSP
jgi:hypothetical protein